MRRITKKMVALQLKIMGLAARFENADHQEDLLTATRIPRLAAAPDEPFTDLGPAMNAAATVATFQQEATVYVDTRLPKTRYFVRGPHDPIAPPAYFTAFYHITRTVVSAKQLAHMEDVPA